MDGVYYIRYPGELIATIWKNNIMQHMWSFKYDMLPSVDSIQRPKRSDKIR